VGRVLFAGLAADCGADTLRAALPGSGHRGLSPALLEPVDRKRSAVDGDRQS
jgi:hypothetical protein